jgi:hypothetical protein
MLEICTNTGPGSHAGVHLPVTVAGLQMLLLPCRADNNKPCIAQHLQETTSRRWSTLGATKQQTEQHMAAKINPVELNVLVLQRAAQCAEHTHKPSNTRLDQQHAGSIRQHIVTD